MINKYIVQANLNVHIFTADTKIELVCEEAEIVEQWSFVEKNPIRDGVDMPLMTKNA